ncbi:MAG: 5-formyltetrahydrofolate cyclo-ligase [Myxococcales bacterium]|nr:5-formyltetrahydrofolate cyclo-ligase [Acidobacteriota bacterium]MDH5308061.1 5-formyltetrahydrofolate cyclo-ligase [Myxococcales bacterium]MDH5567346.1 5-formyltetrahydrofolate cyclo-ligase [Myxococcales bacterium]
MSNALVAEKRRLRRTMQGRRRAVAPAQAEAAGRAVAGHLLDAAAVRMAERVALYAALPGELPTRVLFERLGALGILRLLPRIRQHRIEFARVEDWDALRPGGFDVLEPPDAYPAVELSAADVAVVPGLAFDAQGNRLGHGKGYYDRLLSGDSASLPRLIGAAFELQIVPRVPHDSRDRRMDAIVTEMGLRWIARRA